MPVGLNRLNSSKQATNETTTMALDRLARAGIVTGPEMRHESSLSPIALLRQWVMKTTVHNERHHFRFEGEQTGYGRGLDLESARAACAMEIVERRSAYACFVPGRVSGYQKTHFLRHARASDLQREHLDHLDPNRMTLEVPYPGGPPSRPAMKGLLRVPLEKLPDYSSGNDVRDLNLIETLLDANGFHPIYVDLTRKDLGIPVVRAIVPGMELLGDFDRFSRVNPRLYANYIRMFGSAD